MPKKGDCDVRHLACICETWRDGPWSRADVAVAVRKARWWRDGNETICCRVYELSHVMERNLTPVAVAILLKLAEAHGITANVSGSWEIDSYAVIRFTWPGAKSLKQGRSVDGDWCPWFVECPDLSVEES